MQYSSTLHATLSILDPQMCECMYIPKDHNMISYDYFIDYWIFVLARVLFFFTPYCNISSRHIILLWKEIFFISFVNKHCKQWHYIYVL